MSENITLECIDCHKDFVIEPNEKAWYESKGFTLPKRCKKCRAIKKAERMRA